MTSHSNRSPGFFPRHPVLIICLFCLAAYGHVLFFDFLMQDDYLTARNFWFGWPFLCLGRPVCAVHQELFFQLGPSPLSQSVMRFLSIALLAWTAALLRRWLEKLGYEQDLGLATSLGIITLPPAILYVHWISAGHYLIAFVLCQGAGFALLRSLKANYPAYAGLAFSLQFAAMCTNQAAAMYIWPLVFMLLAKLKTETGLFKKILQTYTPLAASMAAYFICFKLLNSYVMPHQRAGLVQNIPAKLEWFFTYPVPNAMAIWNAYPYQWLVAGVCLVFFFGLAAWAARNKTQIRENSSRFGLKVMALCPILFLCYAPSLATPESWPSYRTLFPLQTLFVFLFFCGLREIAALLRKKFLFRLATGTILFLSLVLVYKNSLVEIIIPQRMELEFIENKISSAMDKSPEPDKIILKMPPHGRRIAPIIRYDEFGQGSTALKWFAPHMAAMAMDRIGLPSGNRPEIIVRADSGNIKEDYPVIDMSEFQGLRDWSISSPFRLPKPRVHYK